MTDEIERWREEIRWLRGLALRLVSDPDLADDLAQETALISLSRDPALGAGSRPWRAGVLRRLVLTRWRERSRRERREAKAHPPAGEPAPDALVEQVEIHRALTDAVLALDEPYRQAVILAYFHDLSSAEISRRTGDPEPTVRSRLRRAIAQLRETLDRRFGGDRRKWAAPLVAWLALSAGGRTEAGADGIGGGASPTPAPLSPISPTAIGGALVSAKKAMVAAAAVMLILAGAGWYAIEEQEVSTPRGGAGSEVAIEASHDSSAEPTATVAAPAPSSALATIRGEVRDRHSVRVVAGASVEIVTLEPERTLARASTGADGAFAIEVPADLGADRIAIRVRSERHVPFEQRIARDAHLRPDPLPTIHLGIGHEVAGRVVDAEGQPVAGAEVLLWSGVTVSGVTTTVWRNSTGFLSLGGSDEDGRFRAIAPRGASFLGAIEGGRCGVAEASVPLAPGEQVEIALTNAEPIRGIVVDELGDPVAGASVTGGLEIGEQVLGVPTDGYWNPTARSDADGRFTLVSFAHPLRLRADHPGYLRWPSADESRAREDSAAPGSERTIVLRRGRTVRGECRFHDGGALTGVPFALAPPVGISIYGRLGSDGVFEVLRFPVDTEGATLHVEGALPVSLSFAPGAEPLDFGTIFLDRGATVRVAVTGPDGEPLAGAGVRVTEQPRSRPWSFRAEARTGADGVASITGFAPGPAVLRTWGEGSGADERTIEIPAEGLSVSVPLRASGRMQGRLVDADGGPIAGVRVRLESATADTETASSPSQRFPDLSPDLFGDTTESDGVFRFPAVPAEMALRLAISAEWLISQVFPVEPLSSGEERDLGDIPVGGGSNLVVEVTGIARNAIGGARVSIRPLGGDLERQILERTDSTGAAQFRALAPGAYLLAVRADDHRPWEQEIEVRSGSDTLSVILDPGGTWDVLVLDADGSPVAGAPIELWGFGQSSSASSGRTDAEGRARLTGIPERPRTYGIRAPGFISLHEEVLAGVLPAEIVLRRGASLQVTFERPEWGPPLTGGIVRVHRSNGNSSTTFDGGAFGRMTDIPPGPGEVEIIAEGYARFTAPVELVAGETAEVVFRPTAAARTFCVLVVDEGGKPCSNARVRARRHSASPMAAWTPLADLELAGEGRYTGEIAEDGVLIDVVVEAPGYGPSALEGVDPETESTISLAPPAGMDVRVVGADRQLAGGVTVRFGPRRHSSVFDQLEIAHRVSPTADGDGRVSLRGLAAIEYYVQVCRGNDVLARTSVSLAAGETRELEISLVRRITISGSVLRNGERWGGGNLAISTANGRAEIPLDEQGAFSVEIEDVPHAEFALTLAEGSSLRFERVPIDPGRPVELAFESVGAEIRFVGPDGRAFGPFDGWLRKLDDGPLQGHFTCRAGPDGIARVPEIPPGRYRLSAALEPGFTVLDDEVVAGSEPTTMRIGAAGVLRVRVASGGSAYVQGFRLSPSGVWMELSWARPGQSLADPRFAIPLGPEGRTVVLECHGRAPLVLDLSGGIPTEPVVLPDRPGGRLQLGPPTGATEAPLRVRIEPLGAPALPEALAFRPWPRGSLDCALPIGTYRVTAEGPEGDVASVEVHIREAETSRAEW